MNTRSLMNGIQILLPYYHQSDGYHCASGDDQLYMYPTDDPVSEEDLNQLYELGWIQINAGDKYNPEEAWTAWI